MEAFISDTDRQLPLLREKLQPGDTVYTVLRYTEENGSVETQYIKCYLIPRPVCVTEEVAGALDLPYDPKHDALRVPNEGTDAEYNIVHRLGLRLCDNSEAFRQERL